MGHLHFYNRNEITQWIRIKGTSPITRKTVTIFDLLDSGKKAQEVRVWLEKQRNIAENMPHH